MKIVILGHQNPDVDSILSGILLEKCLSKENPANTYEFIIPDKKVEQDTLDILEKLNIDISVYQEKDINPEDCLILVDHYDENRFNNQIVGYIDHHPSLTEGKDSKNMALAINTPSCSTTTIIAKTFDISDKDDFILALIGALVDTVSFKSTKTDSEEKGWLEEQCRQLGINIENYYDFGLCLTNTEKIESAAVNGLKTYDNIVGRKVESSYIQIKNVNSSIDTIDNIIDFLCEYRKTKCIDIFVFILHDMDSFETTTYTISDEGIQIKQYDQYTSRGSTIILNLKQELETEDAKKEAKIKEKKVSSN